MSDFVLPVTRYALSGEVNIAYQTMGDGPVDIILVPGLISHVEFLHEFLGYTAFLRRLYNKSPLPAGCPPHHPPAGKSSRHRDADWQPYLPRDRHHGVSKEQRQVGSRAADRQPRIAADNQTLRSPQ